MTVRKQLPLRTYETFPPSSSSEAGQGSSETPSTTDTDKSRLSAAQEAQRLGSQGSWADNVFQTPETTATPTASTVDDQEHPEMGTDPNAYPSDPPPLYTPTDTASSTIPNSPATTRAELVGRTQHSRHSSTSPLATHPEADEEQPIPEDTYTPSSPLLEQGQPDLFQHDSVRWKQGCTNKRRVFTAKTVRFLIALSICLWLMVPSFFYSHKSATRGPHHPHSPDDDLRESPIPTWPVPKREYRQHETSHSIHGTFQLYDLLELETTSGSISITVDVKSGDKPAVMRLATTSGSISINMAPGSWLPWKPKPAIVTNRTLDVQLSTKSGSICGSVLAGNGGRTEISSRSGSQSMTVRTVGVSKGNETTQILTSTGSGSQHVKIVSSSTEDVSAIEGKHLSSGSGSLGIEYPSQWMGKVHAYTDGSGSVWVSGSDLDKQGGGRDVYAWRGEGNLKEVEVHGQGSGSLRFSC